MRNHTSDKYRRPRKRGAAGGPLRAKAGSARLDDAEIREHFKRAMESRADVLADPATDSFRVINGAADGFDGLVIEKFGDVLVAQLHEDRLGFPENTVRDVCEFARRELGARAVYRKWFPKDRTAALDDLRERHSSAAPWLGSPVDQEIVITENRLRYLIRPYDGYSVGLFLEHRENRRCVAGLAGGGAVLNTFAYTCGFSVSAASGGAAETVNVDVSRKYLEWGKRNFELNGLDLDRHQFIRSDIFDYYSRARRQRRSFDLIVLDPPTFGRGKRPKEVFALTDDLQRLVDGAAELLNPGGHILLATNCRKLTRRALERALETALGAGVCRFVSRPKPSADFAGDPGYSKTVIARA